MAYKKTYKTKKYRKNYRKKAKYATIKFNKNGDNVKFKRWGSLDGTGFPTPSPYVRLAVGAGGATFNYFPSTETFALASSATPGQNYFSAGLAFQFANVAGVNEFAALWDQYMITGIKIIFTPYVTQSLSPDSTSVSGCGIIMHSVFDYDDIAAPAADITGINALKEYNSYRCLNILNVKGNKYSRYLTPKVLQALQVADPQGGTTSVVGIKTPGYMDTTTTGITVPHFGLKIIWEMLDNDVTPSQIQIKAELKYYFKMKNQR